MSNVAGWAGDLKQLRLDPIDQGDVSSGSFSIDYIKIQDSALIGDIVTPISEPLYGDLDGDQKITSTDYELFKRYMLDIPVNIKNTTLMDLNGDEIINSVDFVLLRRLILGIITYEDLLDLRKANDIKPTMD